jgi:mono/diheme cytochrome c family protein
MAWLATAPLAAGDAADPLLAEMGAEIYQHYCTACHGLSGKGDGPAASALVVRPADLTRIAARRGGVFPSGEIAKYIDGRFDVTAHGTREMPVWGEHLGAGIPEAGLAEAIIRGKVATLVEYLKSIQTLVGAKN